MIKGILGEFALNLTAKFMLDSDKYHLLKNVTLPTVSGSTQIDHIVVSRYGVFVVETKNMKGWIFGSKTQSQWTQKLFSHTNKFQNPLRQNYKHIKSLESCLSVGREHIHSVIVFLGESEFKTDMPDNVTKGGGYLSYIKSFREQVLSDEQVKLIIEQIQQNRLKPSFSTHRKHVKHVKELNKSKQFHRD